jgi:hypothetical protein
MAAMAGFTAIAASGAMGAMATIVASRAATTLAAAVL